MNSTARRSWTPLPAFSSSGRFICATSWSMPSLMLVRRFRSTSFWDCQQDRKGGGEDE